ncbi:acyl-CoA dehydrogenase family protein [Pseudorhodoferax sp.]|uniref:acyl-CoA dehydrogenase family protein n=1 Tax=Pseudorhodoferax sp. TaxID=1993553 RepID=UPI002DD6638B|nr:acyl-CoA dehydrogenase family protein [Pseudorhodoferax sp.]
MTQHHTAWGAAPSPRYEALAQRFRPVFQRIRDSAVERDLQHRLPHEELHWLRAEGFARLRLPVERGGSGATLTEFFGLLVELGTADTNVVNALRAHFGFTEDVLNSGHAAFREHWLGRIAEGQTIGSGFSEAGEAKVGSFSTKLVRDGNGQLRLSGQKFYTTGSLFADWINTATDDEDGKPTLVLVPRKAAGVQVDDDWDGFGQALTASGTARFDDVAIEPAWINPAKARFAYSSPYYQLVHLASLAGIARALSEDLAQRVRERTRTYSHANSGRSAQDPQVLQVVGRVHAAAYGANAIVQQAARALERAWQARDGDAAALEQANVQAHVETDQAVPVVTQLVLDASTQLFDALGASATLRPAGLDRYWRNARTISSHNPRIYRERQAGDYAVNGTPPPTFYRVGTA